ncbi:hypothetical protein [Amycolatopsis sp. MtRt-6]|uniref:hypothetical protein n=1 Tax=Amycolatopsis sp. MtRt-6 TaxID=2792782 RepID=UPI001A8ED1EE|nr:hypothetical protein [Amycolatopsis sp. MtRt-6]
MEFASALAAAFEVGPAEVPGLAIDRLDGRTIAAGPVPACGHTVAESVGANLCRAEPAVATICRGEPAVATLCRAELAGGTICRAEPVVATICRAEPVLGSVSPCLADEPVRLCLAEVAEPVAAAAG